MKQLTYENEDIVVIWKPDLCKHAGICVKTLPMVYNPKARPWIQINNATTQDLIMQITACPTGALSYLTKSDK